MKNRTPSAQNLLRTYLGPQKGRMALLALLIFTNLGLVLAGFSLVALLVLTRFRNLAVPHWEAERQAEADFYSFLEERLAGTADLRANGGRLIPYT